MSYSEEWFDIQQKVSQFYKKHGSDVWFRGHSKSNEFELNAGIFRNNNKSVEQILMHENSLYTEFHDLGQMDHQTNGWNLLYIMQHHGVQTRLLDWTESFATALYFAYIGWEPNKQDACVWMLAPHELNKLVDEEGEGSLITQVDSGTYVQLMYRKEKTSYYKNSVALHPVKNNKRIVAQRGVFTLQGDTLKPLNEEFDGELINKHHLMKIELKKHLYTSVQEFLELSGVTHYTLFPDLDGLARLINTPENERNFRKKL